MLPSCHSSAPYRALAVCSALTLGCGPLLDGSAASCGAGAVPIAEVQGPGPLSPRDGEWLSVEGGVSGAARVGSHDGFFLQSLEPAADPARSRGLFVALEGAPAPAAGQRVQVHGQVQELQGVTALAAVDLLAACGRAALKPLAIELDPNQDAERWEGMWVHSRQEWTLINTSELSQGRLGVSVSGRPYAAGHPLGAGAAAAEPRWALEGLQQLAEQWLEDGTASEHLRLGARANALTALVLSASPPTLRATSGVDFRSDPPGVPARRQGSLRVAALNLGNFFLELGARGARTPAELSRQNGKLVAALHELDADILALSELGSSTPGAGAAPARTSLSELIGALNSGAPDELAYTGSDGAADGAGLHSALLYRASRARPSGAAWSARSRIYRRAPLFLSFEVGSALLTLAAVHLKSKLCDGAEQVLGPEGCGAAQRRDEARALAGEVAALPPALGQHLLLIGDFNADALEQPLLELRRAGLSDLFEGTPPRERYTYVFDARPSQLDHALASPALAAALVAAQLWHINADEPEQLGYRSEHASPDARRSSDHDPILVDFAL